VIDQQVTEKARRYYVQSFLSSVFECETVNNIVVLNSGVENTCRRSSARPSGKFGISKRISETRNSLSFRTDTRLAWFNRLAGKL
jgi:hypothetical protein